MDRLTPVVDFKAARESHAARQLRDAHDIERRQREEVENHRRALAADRPLADDAALCMLGDLADARTRDHLVAAEQTLASTEQRVSALRDEHLQALVEHRALVRLQERRREEARVIAARREQRSQDEFASR